METLAHADLPMCHHSGSPRPATCARAAMHNRRAGRRRRARPERPRHLLCRRHLRQRRADGDLELRRYAMVGQQYGRRQNGTDTCQNGICSGPPRTCNDGNVCTDDACDATTGCTVIPDNTNPCSDGSACTVADRCSAGSCTGTASCVRRPSLIHNGVEGCNPLSGVTPPGARPVCGDAVGCTIDSCSEPLERCVNEPDDADCDDANTCTIDACAWRPAPVTAARTRPTPRPASDSRAYGLSVQSLGLLVVPPDPGSGRCVTVEPGQAPVNAAPLAVVDLFRAVSDTAVSDASGASASAMAETAKIQLVANSSAGLSSPRRRSRRSAAAARTPRRRAARTPDPCSPR